MEYDSSDQEDTEERVEDIQAQVWIKKEVKY